MIQKEKELLLKDLTARLRYGVKILHETWNYEWDQEMSLLERVVGIDEKFVYVKVIDTYNGEEYRDDKIPISTFDDMMFLRPMSSMTEEEREELEHLSDEYFGIALDKQIEELVSSSSKEGSRVLEYIASSVVVDWLNEHHFDYRGLIEKGLALEAPEDMYKH